MRTCGECTLCCKLLMIPELKKPADRWCEHCVEGCGIYNERPKSCREFECMWLQSSWVPDRYRPDRVGYFAVRQGDVTIVYIDDDRVTDDFSWLTHLGHVVVKRRRTLEFRPGQYLPPLEKLTVDWILAE